MHKFAEEHGLLKGHEGKVTLTLLKVKIKEFKKSACPRLSSGKDFLMKFAVEHKLLKHKEEHVETATKAHEAKEVKVEEPKKHKEPMDKKSMLSEVQKIRKERNVSLKEAWAIHKAEMKKPNPEPVSERRDLTKKKIFKLKKVEPVKEPVVERRDLTKKKVFKLKKSEPVVAEKGRKDMSGSDMASYDNAKLKKDKKTMKYYEENFPGLKNM